MPGTDIQLDRIGFAYEGCSAVDDLTLSVPAGEVTALVGPSGSGKSTVLQLIAGLLPLQGGDILFNGDSVRALSPEKRGLGVVFQNYALFPHLTVEDNVGFGLRARGRRRRDARREVDEVLERLEISRLRRRRPHQLSGGEQQRVALARALACSPNALLLDEPLAALDARLRISLRAELSRHLHESGATVLYVTHDQEEAMALADHVAVIRAGKLEQAGTAEELYRQPASPFVAAFIGEANFLPVGWDPEQSRLRGPLGDWVLDETTADRFNGLGGGRLMLRPESFRPVSDDEADLTGTVLGSTFLGEKRRLLVAIREHQLKVDLPADTVVTVGSLLPLAIDFGASVLLPEFDPESLHLEGGCR